MARIRGETGVTVAAGENIGNAGEARRAIELGALDIFQPSVTKIGGIAAAITIARQHGVPLGAAIDARDGHMQVPQRPGLGIDVDETVIERYRVVS